MWKEAAVSYFDVLSRHLNHMKGVKPRQTSVTIVCKPMRTKVQSRHLQKRSMSATYCTVMLGEMVFRTTVTNHGYHFDTLDGLIHVIGTSNDETEVKVSLNLTKYNAIRHTSLN
jgi:hypothetical protein